MVAIGRTHNARLGRTGNQSAGAINGPKAPATKCSVALN